VFESGPEWDGKLARLSGPSLEKVENLLINLPRSAKDHVCQGLAFGPDGALHFPVGSSSAIGRADANWNNQQENLLSAAIMRLSLSLLSTYALPLNVKTAEGGGNYSPYNSFSPLTIYASGVRNAYDLLWHSNGGAVCTYQWIKSRRQYTCFCDRYQADGWKPL
jgi:glucose/arabinose dehydrogenase